MVLCSSHSNNDNANKNDKIYKMYILNTILKVLDMLSHIVFITAP